MKIGSIVKVKNTIDTGRKGMVGRITGRKLTPFGMMYEVYFEETQNSGLIDEKFLILIK